LGFFSSSALPLLFISRPLLWTASSQMPDEGLGATQPSRRRDGFRARDSSFSCALGRPAFLGKADFLILLGAQGGHGTRHRRRVRALNAPVQPRDCQEWVVRLLPRALVRLGGSAQGARQGAGGRDCRRQGASWWAVAVGSRAAKEPQSFVLAASVTRTMEPFLLGCRRRVHTGHRAHAFQQSSPWAFVGELGRDFPACPERGEGGRLWGISGVRCLFFGAQEASGHDRFWTKA